MSDTDAFKNLFEQNHELNQELIKCKQENRRWAVTCEELRKTVIGYEAKTRMEVKLHKRLGAYKQHTENIIRLLRKNGMAPMASLLEEKLAELAAIGRTGGGEQIVVEEE